MDFLRFMLEDWAGRFVFLLCAVTVALVFWALAQPSCEDRGGKSVRNGSIVIYQKIGQVMVPQTVPKYDCVMPDSLEQ